MVLKIFVSRCSGNMEMKRKQDFVHQLLDGRHIEYEEIDISDPQLDNQKQYMRENAKPIEGQKVPLPPQIFDDDQYLGDYEAIHEANEDDQVFEFLKLAPPKNATVPAITLSERDPNVASDDNVNVHTVNDYDDELKKGQNGEAEPEAVEPEAMNGTEEEL